MLSRLYINLLLLNIAAGNPDAKRLYSNLLANYDRYLILPSMEGLRDKKKLTLISRLIRPVANSSDRLTVHMRLKLSQVIGVVRTNN